MMLRIKRDVQGSVLKNYLEEKELVCLLILTPNYFHHLQRQSSNQVSLCPAWWGGREQQRNSGKCVSSISLLPDQKGTENLVYTDYIR
jgi:hypothetical protein